MDKRVVIIGTSFRFPGTTPQSFWHDLLANKDLVSHVEEGRWSFDAYTHPDKKHPGTSYTFQQDLWAMFLDSMLAFLVYPHAKHPLWIHSSVCC